MQDLAVNEKYGRVGSLSHSNEGRCKVLNWFFILSWSAMLEMEARKERERKTKFATHNAI